MGKPEETKSIKVMSIVTFAIWLLFVMAMMGN